MTRAPRPAVLTGGECGDCATPSWMQDAACAAHQKHADDWFKGEGRGASHVAKAVCMGCAVRTDCLLYALANDISDGVWGGMTTRERRLVRWTKA